MTTEKQYELKQVSVRLKLCEEAPLYSTEQINTPRKAIDVMKDMLRQLDREYVCVVNLDNGNRPINFNIVSMGTINSSVVSMRELLKSALLCNSTGLILLHNHPSYRTEKPEPSPEDNITTLNVMIASNLLGLTLQDHVIVSGGTGSIYSYRTELKDKFSIEGLKEIVEQKKNRCALLEPRQEYHPDEAKKPVPGSVKAAEVKAKSERPVSGRPSLIARMNEKKAALAERNRLRQTNIQAHEAR